MFEKSQNFVNSVSFALHTIVLKCAVPDVGSVSDSRVLRMKGEHNDPITNHDAPMLSDCITEDSPTPSSAASDPNW